MGLSTAILVIGVFGLYQLIHLLLCWFMDCKLSFFLFWFQVMSSWSGLSNILDDVINFFLVCLTVMNPFDFFSFCVLGWDQCLFMMIIFFYFASLINDCFIMFSFSFVMLFTFFFFSSLLRSIFFYFLCLLLC